MAKYPPVFKRVQTNPEKEGKLIGRTQEEFEIFWRGISKKCPKNSERTMAMRKMQEACMWLTRGIALGGFKSDDEAVMEKHKNGFKGDFSDKAPQPLPNQKVDGKSLSEDGKTTIVVKKKRQYTNTNP